MAFPNEKAAQAHCDKVLGVLGDKWKGKIRQDGVGDWDVSWQWGAILLRYMQHLNQYNVSVGNEHDDLIIYEHFDDPKAAVLVACDHAIEVFESEWKPIMLSVAVVRLSL